VAIGNRIINRAELAIGHRQSHHQSNRHSPIVNPPIGNRQSATGNQ